MSECPTSEHLARLLAGALPESGDGTLREHVAACARCQTALDQLSDDSGLRRWRTGRGLAPDRRNDEGAFVALMDRLRDWTPHDSTKLGRREPNHEAVSNFVLRDLDFWPMSISSPASITDHLFLVGWLRSSVRSR